MPLPPTVAHRSGHQPATDRQLGRRWRWWVLCGLTGLWLPLAPLATDLSAAEAAPAEALKPEKPPAPAHAGKPTPTKAVAPAGADRGAPAGDSLGHPLPGGDASGRPLTVAADGMVAPDTPLPPLDHGPAPILIAAEPATRQKAVRLIQELDSPAAEVANRAFSDLVALDGGALAAINSELLTQLHLRQRGSLNLQHRLRAALQIIAVQIPDSYRTQLLAERRRAAAERERIVRQVLGRHDEIHPTAQEIKLQDVPTRLDAAQFDAILHLSGDWPARFLEKFLLAGGLSVDLPAPVHAGNAAMMQAMQIQRQDMGLSELPDNPFIAALVEGPTAALRRIDGGFYLQWQALMQKLYPDPATQAAVIAITRRGLVGRTDPAALDWALTTVRGALGDTLTGEAAAADETGEEATRAATSAVGLAIEMLGQGARPADLQLLRTLAFQPETPWRSTALEALRLHWTTADLPALIKLVRDANRARDYNAVITTALALESTDLDAAVAARADWFGNENLQWLLQQYVLERGSPVLIDAALQAWATEDSLSNFGQVLAVAFHRTAYYPLILKSIYNPTNERLNYDTSLSPGFYMLAQDPATVKPWLYALNDLLGLGRKEYAATDRYDAKLFAELQEVFKDTTNVNTVYPRTRIVAEARLLLAVAGDSALEAEIHKALEKPINQAGMRRMDFDQILLMWYCRLLPQYPLPELLPLLDKVDQRYYGGRVDSQRQVYDPPQVRAELAGQFNQNQAFWYNRQRNLPFGRRLPPESVSGVDQPPPPAMLNYSYEPRLTAALQYHVPELAAAIFRDHAAEFDENPGLRMNAASSLPEMGAYAQGAALYEALVVDLPGQPPRVAMRNDNDGQLYSVCNNLAWLYATALDPAWCKADRAVQLAEEAVRLAPGMSYSIDTRAYAYLVAGRYAESLADFEASARLLGFGDSAGIASSLARQARALHGLKRDDEARRRLDQAVSLQPTDGETLFWIARGYGLLGANDHALRLLAKAEAAGFMYHEQVVKSSDFDGIRHQRLYQNVLDNMRRHRKLIREIVLEYTPVSQVPAEIDSDDPGPLPVDADPNTLRRRVLLR